MAQDKAELVQSSLACLDQSLLRQPFLLKPLGKDYIWGGARLHSDFNLQGLEKIEPLAEAWVCSTHPDGASRVISTDEDLRIVLRRHPEWLGTHPLTIIKGKPELPILIKLIDAKQDLSVQVHPDDSYALKHEGQLGKTEMWYVLDATPNASLVYGFSRKVTVTEIRKAIENGTLERYLNRIPVCKGDIFFIEPGTVHAIGSGCLIAEVQESSNVTYRLYDYNRKDKNGKKRELHIDKALDVMNFSSSTAPHQPMRVLNYKLGCAVELLARCRYFQVERMLINTEELQLQTENNSFHTLLCVSGYGNCTSDIEQINFSKGDCIFVPAENAALKLKGKAQLLNVSC